MPTARPALTRERVVGEAVALADVDGLGALSMRALATRLGVEAMSLYHHVRGKEELLDAMVDAVFGEIHLPPADGSGAGWRAEMRARSVSGRDALRRHRWAVGLMDSRRAPGPASVAHHDAVLGCLLRDGFDLAATGTAFALLDAHLYGFVLQENALPFDTVDELVEIGAELLVPEVRAAYPHFTAFAEGQAMQPGYSFGREFEPTLELVLDAVERLRTQAVGHAAADVGAARPDPVEVVVPVLGVDGCPGGWVGAVLVPGAPRPRVVVAATIAELVEAVRAEVPVQVVGIDIPIGLPDSTIRQADVLARRSLKGRASSVFTTLTRRAYEQSTRAEADEVNRGLSGQGVGAQAFALRAKILEVDAWLRTRPTVEVLEVHPEVSFAAMAGAPLPGKRTAEGQQARLDALAAAGVARPSVLKGTGYAPDDVLDACAVAWTAARRAAGLSRSLPPEPEVFSDGIVAAIHV